MKDLFRSTSGGKTGAIDGLNLFFGALLGANLGSIQGMSLPYYVELIFLLAAVVMTVRMLSTSPRRTYMLDSRKARSPFPRGASEEAAARP